MAVPYFRPSTSAAALNLGNLKIAVSPCQVLGARDHLGTVQIFHFHAHFHFHLTHFTPNSPLVVIRL